jgi:Zn-dependent protease
VKLLGIPIKIEVSFFVLSFFLATSGGRNLPLLIEWLVVVFVSVLLHELGHALVARKFGLAPSIKLYSMGGLTSWESNEEVTPLRHILISLAGPGAGFLFGGIAYIAGPALLESGRSQLLTAAYFDFLWVNIGWGIFNLLPMLPLDGGHVLLTLGEWISKRKGRLISHFISLGVALAITYLALVRRSVWIAILGAWLVHTNGRFLTQKFQTYRDQRIRPLLDQARDAFYKSEFDKAIELTRQAEKKAHTVSIRSEAAHLHVFLLIHQHRLEEAAEQLHRFEVLFGEDSYLRGLFHFEREDMAAAIPHLKQAFEESPSEQLGMILYQALINERNYVEAMELCGDPLLAEVSWKFYVNLLQEAFASGEFRIAAEAGSLAFEKQSDPDVAYNVACSLARDSRSKEAFEWLERAIATGFQNKDLIAGDPDLESLRSHAEFDELLAKLASG